MKGHGEKLSRKQELAIGALLTEATLAAAAEAIGIGEVTLWRWTQRGDFQAAYRAARREAVGQAISAIQQASSQAVQTLREVMLDTNTPPSCRIAAAKVVLDIALKGIELEDLEQRLSALEEASDDGRVRF